MTFWIAGDFVEQHGRIPHLSLVQVDDAADFLLALSTVYPCKLSGGVYVGDPISQILVGHAMSP